MKRILRISIIVIFLISTAPAAFSQKPKSRVAAPKTVAQTKVDLGNLSGNTYTNDFFALKFEFPLGWLVGDNVLESQLKQLTQGQVKTQNPQAQGAMNKAVDRVTPLLGGYKSLPGTPENPSLRVMVEDLRTLPQVKTGKDYLGRLYATMKIAKLPADFTYSEVKTETIDNLPLDYIETSSGSNKKRLYVTVRKGYAVLMAIDYYEQSDFDALHTVLTEADLDYKK